MGASSSSVPDARAGAAPDAEPRRVHGDRGAYVGGDWVEIEDCAELFNIGNGSQSRCGGDCLACPRSRSRHTSARPDGTYDVVIIGAGCIGSAIARELSRTTASVLLLEAADDVTQGATKGNSGIIHAGFDDKPGSVRAKYCWHGNQMFPQLDRELHFGFQRNGSLVVAKSDSDVQVLRELLDRGAQNGVRNLRIVEQAELRRIEPTIDPAAIAALFSPDAGTITPYEYTIALAENAVDNGVELRTRRKVVDVRREEAGGFTVIAQHWEPKAVAARLGGRSVAPSLVGAVAAVGAAAILVEARREGTDSDLAGWAEAAAALLFAVALIAWRLGASRFSGWLSYSPSPGTHMGGVVEGEQIRTRFVVNAAGTSSDAVAAMVGDTSFQIKPRMGEYILLHKDEGFKARHVLFPAPHPYFGKGCLVQSTLWGNLILGPTARDTVTLQPDGSLAPNEAVLKEPSENILGWILSKSRGLVPSFDAGAVIHTFAGARAKNTTGDWVIGPVAGPPGFINAASVDSPGIAASPAIAVDVVRMLREAGAPVSEPDPLFNPNRAPIITPKDGFKGLKMSKTEPWKVKDPTQNVVCKCERVTEAEVIAACRRSLPIDSTQAIRKRTRAGMGHCQGDPDNYGCEARVAAIIARETKCPEAEVGRRPFPASSLMRQRIFEESDRERLRNLSDPSREFVLHGAAA
jgi:L-2-hydroxyglutarate oxidase LhgO